jgi:hypothetical protein
MTVTEIALREQIAVTEAALASLDEDIAAFNAIDSKIKKNAPLLKLLDRYDVGARLTNDRRGEQDRLDRLTVQLAQERIEFTPPRGGHTAGDANHYSSTIKLSDGRTFEVAGTPSSTYGAVRDALGGGRDVSLPIRHEDGRTTACEIDPNLVERVA